MHLNTFNNLTEKYGCIIALFVSKNLKLYSLLSLDNVIAERFAERCKGFIELLSDPQESFTNRNRHVRLLFNHFKLFHPIN